MSVLRVELTWRYSARALAVSGPMPSLDRSHVSILAPLFWDKARKMADHPLSPSPLPRKLREGVTANLVHWAMTCASQSGHGTCALEFLEAGVALEPLCDCCSASRAKIVVKKAARRECRKGATVHGAVT